MKIKSLLLGSAAAVALSSAAVAGGAPSLGDICSELDITGVTISSDDTCLKISGSYDFEVEFEDSTGDWESLVTDNDASLGFLAVQGSDYGAAQLFIEIGVDDISDHDVQLESAWVSVGNDQVFTAGLKGDLFDDGNDGVFNAFGLLRDGIAAGDHGDGLSGDLNTTGIDGSQHYLMQFMTDLGNGLDWTISLEDLQNSDVGFDGIHVASQINFNQAAFDGFLFGEMSNVNATDVELALRGVMNFNIDDYGKVRLAGGLIQNDGNVANDDHWHVLASFETMVDVITLAVSGELIDDNGTTGYSLGASAAFDAADGVTLTLGGFYGDSNDNGVEEWKIGLKADVDVADDLVLTLEGTHSDDEGTEDTDVSAKLTWKPTDAQEWFAKVAADVDGSTDVTLSAGAKGSF